jgi:polyribonucleotide nucleotidyltransferase
MSILEKYAEADKFSISQAFDYVQKKAFRVSVLDKQRRVDGRNYQELRPISCEVGVLPRAHGSAIFQRGETQALALATLAPIEEAQMIDAYGGGEHSKRFILHYNFPPFSVGETGRTGGASRREIGHGALAERSLGRWCRARTIFATPFASPARLWNQTDRHPWPAFAAACLH